MGPLQGLWGYYRATHAHRGRSHWPLFGSAERWLYLALLLLLPSLTLMYLVGSSPAEVGAVARAWWSHGGSAIALTVYAGAEVACLWHLVCDYTPGLNQF